MSGILASELKEYFEGARRFDQDRLASLVRQRNLGFAVGGIGLLCAAAACIGIAGLAPLKSDTPFVLQEDKTTGLVQLVSTLTETKETEPEAVAKYFLAQYVTARESYLDAEAPYAFHKVSVMSAPEEQKRFGLWYNPSNPDSPQLVFGKKEIAEVHLRGISFLNPRLAQIRYTLFVRDVDGDQTQARRSDYVSTVEFRFEHKLKMSEGDRLINPVGFWVTAYRRDIEVVQ